MQHTDLLLVETPGTGTLAGGLLSIEPGKIHLHVSTHCKDRLRKLQSLARKIAGLGVVGPRFEGSWDLDARWAVTQGLSSAKRPIAIDPGPELAARQRCVAWLKDVTNASPEVLGPEQLAQSALALLQHFGGSAIQAQTLSGAELKAQGYVGIYEVGRGSTRAPVLLSVDFNPSGNPEMPFGVALVGKGITFDSGGYSIKESTSMLGMKCDMGGAATVTAALALAIASGLNKRVKLILCCAENLISGHAYKLGDILNYRNGVSVEIVNTDAEGRLVLADGLLDAAASGAPWIIDAATLTGAAVTALGTDYHAVFSNHFSASTRYLACAAREQELHWPLPLESFHQGKCPSAYADTANSRPVKGGGPGGASNAAGFLSRFVPESAQWLHLDLAASFSDQDTALFAAGATGHGVRTLAAFLTEL